MKEEQGGYEYEDFKSQEFKEPNTLESILNYIIGGGVSTSEIRGAHTDIDKLIENADEKSKIARISRTQRGRKIEDMFRILNPDSTIKILPSGEIDRYYDDDRYGSISEATYARLLENIEKEQNDKSLGLDKNAAAYRLAEERNNPFIP